MIPQAITHQMQEKTWRVELVRLSVFFKLPIKTETSSEWWKSVVGDVPERSNVQTRTGVRQDEGPYGEGRLILNAQPQRADWLFLPVVDQQSGAPAFDQLPFFESISAALNKIAMRSLEISPPISRIAFGLILDMPVQDRPNGYKLLGSYLRGVQIDSDNSSDFLYQINRPRQSKQIPGLLINRLSKWFVLTTKFSHMELGPAFVQYIIPGDERIFTRLELDINSAADHQDTFSSSQLLKLFSELMGLAVEIAVKGDIS